MHYIIYKQNNSVCLWLFVWLDWTKTMKPRLPKISYLHNLGFEDKSVKDKLARDDLCWNKTALHQIRNVVLIYIKNKNYVKQHGLIDVYHAKIWNKLFLRNTFIWVLPPVYFVIYLLFTPKTSTLQSIWILYLNTRHKYV